ncbi:MAG TPA: DNA polymerase III subunit gamma/tau [Clostridia bacterium]|nr:DNA polymerase III subunit gamma/tau [Clostridia bacterium]
MEPTERYVSLYRKYRPTTFDSVIGQETVVRILKGSVDTGRTSHAYLFAGPKGTGKTTVARILAKALNCDKGPNSHPCMECEHCRAITSGTDVDVIEIDAASNRGIDEIRDLRESTRFVPARSRRKIFIIDEAHMLTIQAFNALLKTLEEPPEYVMFILATTEPQKLPETILSRCQRFDFKRIGETAMFQYLQGLRSVEAPNVTDDALHQIVALSGGSMRGAIGLVDQFSVFGTESVSGATVLDLLGLPTEENLALLVEALLSHDPKGVTSVLDQLERSGIEPADLLERSIALISRYIVDKVTMTPSTLEGIPADHLKAFPDLVLVNLAGTFARIQQQSVYLSDPYPLVQAFLLAMALGLPMSLDHPRDDVSHGVQFTSIQDVPRPALSQAETMQNALGLSPDSPPGVAPQSLGTLEGEPAERWGHFKALVSEASRPIGVMLQALDVREVGVDQGALRIVLGPKTKLFRAMLEQKQDEVLVPAARSVYAVDRVNLVDEGSQQAVREETVTEAPVDDKLELLKKTFDATESLFGS